MNLERAIRARQMKDYTQGEKVFCPEEFYEQGILSTQQRKGPISVNFERTKDFPRSLTLRAIVIPVPFQTVETQGQDYPSKIQYIANGSVTQAVPFYQLSSVYKGYEELGQMSWHKSVELRFNHYGLWGNKPFHGNKFKNFNIVLGPNSLIFRKDFHVQTKAYLIQQSVIMNQDHWIVTDAHGHTKTNGTPLLSYGGFYRPGIPIDKIMPTFAVVASHQNSTHLTLFSLTALKERGVTPPKGGICALSHWYFADDLPLSSLMSLSSCLQEGFAEVILEDQKTQETCRYISKDFKYVGLGNSEIEIIFVPKLKGN